MARKVLLVYPRFAPNNFLNWEYMAPFYPGKRAVLPPLGLLLLAGRLGERFDVRLVDENVRPLAAADLHWADAVALSGMHPQRRRIDEIVAWAGRLGRLTLLGGPSASICPEYYPAVDALHVGEMGDATDELVAWLATAEGPQARQRVFTTREKTPLDVSPLPRLDVLDPNAYLVMPVQFSVGCPFTCEFCDIPVLYGRSARLKSPERVVAELQAVYDTGFVGTILFVDDNLIANRKALRTLLPEVIAWQTARRFPYPLTGEASINLARDPEIVALLHDARFTHLFVGVESPDPATLRDISKRQNVLDPLVDSLRVLESHGLEVILGMILGFDNDTPDSGRATARFIDEAKAPIVYFNLLAALPKTPLWARLEAEGRLDTREGDARQSEDLLSCLTSNVKFKLGLDTVRRMLRETVRDVYSPEAVYRRLGWNAAEVYGRQVQGVPPVETASQRRFLIRFTLGTLFRVVRDAGLRGEHRRAFWRYAALLLRLRLTGRIRSFLEVLLRTAPNAHHLITWGRRLLAEAEAPAPAETRAVAAPVPAAATGAGLGPARPAP